MNFFQNRVDADNLIEYQTAQVLINNSDYPHKNHYLFHDLARDRWMALAWDLDLTYGKLWDGNYGGVLNDKMHNPGISPWYTTSVRGEGTGNFLLDKFFAQSGTFYRRAYLVRLWDALQEKYRQDVYEAKITALSDLLYDDQAEDIAAWGRSPATANDPTAPAGFLSNLGRVRDHLRLRRAYLLGYLQNTEGFRGHDRLKITEIMYHPTSGEDAEYLELWNPSGKEITLTGWKIEGLEGVDGQGVLQEYRFPAGLKVATDEVFIVAKDPARFRAIYGEVARVLGPYAGNLDDGGETLRVRDAGPGYPATVDFVRYSTDDPWPWRPDGFGYSLELFDVTADRDNDLPGSWRASLLACGSPGGIHRPSSGSTVFRRGNCNGDGQVDVSDALAILLYLFAGNVQPACLDGCDVNGDLAVGVADAVALIQYLFATNGFPVPPPGPSQCQPAREGFCEVSNC